MDSSPGPHHSHTHGQPFHLQPSEGEYDTSSVNTTSTQSIDIPESASHNVSSEVSTPGYEYQSSPNAPAKRLNESAPPPETMYPLKRLKVEESDSSSSNCSLSECSAPTEAPAPDSESERSSRVKVAGNKQFRSRSLPPTLRRRRRTHQESIQQHIPPVTLNTLRELDLHEIYRNPKLRHDVVFDSQLHFRPNLDGTRGRRKKEMADMYWQIVLRECEVVLGSSKWKNAEMFSTTPRKLPILFETMRDILLTLVPKTDRSDVESILDPPLLMQQLKHNVLDFKGLSLWLATVLKAHCAPMRDQWVEQMVAKVAHGVDNRKVSALVEGIQMVFGILEAMKLDVANHQIRTLRPHLISTAISFEQGYFQERIDQGRLDMKEPRSWFANAVAARKTNEAPDHMAVFTGAVVDMLAPSQYAKYPATFVFDYERLEGLRDDIREATCLKMAILFFRQLTLSSKRDVDAATIDKLRTSIIAILGEEDGVHRWLRHSNAVALHVAQTAYEFNGSTGIADASTVKMAENWFAKHLQTNSPIYVHVEKEISKELTGMVLRIIKGWSSLSTFSIMQSADVTGSSMELASIAQRASHIVFMHWRIFGKMYLAS
ncbi:Tcp11-domain-containing protein [Choiromyces venosus 120613-1]|uniref:Tcp11-domain-containing protein n=1 Tax=Choiromyces venosus 120613-1 TaxID=1336337 RepID=A0A3N4JFU2_9PEZI|nr:Tcp11-domain-containing protein [Choiromyces venosus 120613-1]